MPLKRSLQVLDAFIFFLLIMVTHARAQNPDPKVLEAAKKEGQMVFYTTMTLDQSKEVIDRFQKKYPFIKATLFRTGGGPLLNKILTEARGGLHAWDVVAGRAEMYVPLMERKLLASYRSPETKAIDEDLVDKEGYWTAYYVVTYVLGLAYETGETRGRPENLRGFSRSEVERTAVLRQRGIRDAAGADARLGARKGDRVFPQNCGE
ncbi:MAG TPA: hypothetical protein VHM64_01570 [Candidatus Binatia bacterium]|nr:hypothetical protein [Candidatus Binatia bacterium]